MTRAIKFALLPLAAAALLSGASGQAATCRVTEAQLLGDWKGFGQFQEMSFEKVDGKNRFNSWLHQRPEYTGWRWTLDKCRLKIEGTTGPGSRFDFFISRADPQRLVMVDMHGGQPQTYNRIAK